jgi:gamma-glutamyltranspeptidase/glutathione hydrolase
MIQFQKPLYSIVIAVCLYLPSAALSVEEGLAPEAFTGITAKEGKSAELAMVVAANPLAAQAGAKILRKGGSAADAAIAVQLVLNLVEPQSSGIGGGAFALWYNAKNSSVVSFDGRETAPAAVTSELFLDENGQPLRFFDAVVGGRSVGAPGTVKLLHELHQRYGKLPWSELFTPAIDLATEGFLVSPRLALLLSNDVARLSRDPESRNLFFPDGSPLQSGDTLKTPAFAATLTLIANQGSDAFYEGEIGQEIIRKVNFHPNNPGVLSLADLENYEVIERAPVCGSYRDKKVCGMGPPSSGGLTVLQILGMLEAFETNALNVDFLHLLAEASKLAFADRAIYMADSDFVSVPTAGLIDKNYLRLRSNQIKPDQALPTPVTAGSPPQDQHSSLIYGADDSIELPSTSHFSIVDADGNGISVTTSIENAFGSRLMVGGFLLNNQLTDFSFRPEHNGKPIANRVEPGKRPRSSMAPTIILNQDDSLYALVGSPGGSRIIGFVAQAIISMIDQGASAQQAATLPHLINRNGVTELESDTDLVEYQEALEALGHVIKLKKHTSGLHIIAIDEGLMSGGADSRREGQVVAVNSPERN